MGWPAVPNFFFGLLGFGYRHGVFSISLAGFPPHLPNTSSFEESGYTLLEAFQDASDISIPGIAGERNRDNPVFYPEDNCILKRIFR
jgi:hypothetical protein